MRKILTAVLSKVFHRHIVVVENIIILLFSQGHWNSVKSRSAIDAAGKPIPWYTYPAIEYLGNFDFSQCDVFEFGSGNSSLYWSSRARSVMSVEDNYGWFEIVNKNHRNNHAVIYREDKLT
jgi:hypothetical protein